MKIENISGKFPVAVLGHHTPGFNIPGQGVQNENVPKIMVHCNTVCNWSRVKIVKYNNKVLVHKGKSAYPGCYDGKKPVGKYFNI